MSNPNEIEKGQVTSKGKVYPITDHEGPYSLLLLRIFERVLIEGHFVLCILCVLSIFVWGYG